MKQMIVKSSSLDTDCWVPWRYLEKCWECGRYHYCSYKGRVVNKEYDRLMAKIRKARVEFAKWKEVHK